MSLHSAARSGDLERIKLLIDDGSDIDVKDKFKRTPLHLAAYSGQPADNSTTAVHFAAQQGHQEIVQFLIGCGQRINVANGHGATPLHLACQKGYTDLCVALITMGANLQAKDHKNRTPLQCLPEAVSQEMKLDILTKVELRMAELESERRVAKAAKAAANHLGDVDEGDQSSHEDSSEAEDEDNTFCSTILTKPAGPALPLEMNVVGAPVKRSAVACEGEDEGEDSLIKRAKVLPSAAGPALPPHLL